MGGPLSTESCTRRCRVFFTAVAVPVRRCEHGRRRSTCLLCGGSQICNHGRVRSQCGECRGAAVCEHSRRLRTCSECLTPHSCPHGRTFDLCKDCGGGDRLLRRCDHGRRLWDCPVCWHPRRCSHGRVLWQCHECRASRHKLCVHGSRIHRCGFAADCRFANTTKFDRSVVSAVDLRSVLTVSAATPLQRVCRGECVHPQQAQASMQTAWW